MNYDPRSGGPAQGSNDANESRKGSVRAARERMQAAQIRTQLPDTSRIIGLPQRPNQLVLQNSSRKTDASAPRSIPSDYRDSAGRESPEPQWPLPNTTTNVPQFSPIIPPPSPEHLQPPEQNGRPVSDEYLIQQLSPDYLSPASSNYPGYGGANGNGDLFSPTSHRSSRPLTTSSVASEVSSLGDIPDFPIPEIPSSQQARRVPSLGPPPSARRGPSSYYTQMSYVSPIVEESESRSAASRSRHGSFASSNVFPLNNEDFYPDDDLLSDDETITSDRGTASPEHDDQSGLVKQSPALVRQASLGRRTKPSLMTIKSIDSFGSGGKKKAAGLDAAAGTVGAGGAILAARDGSSSRVEGSRLSHAGSQGSSSTSSSDSVSATGNMKGKSANHAGSPTSPHPLAQEMRPSGLAERAGMRRPPKLDIDAVRDAEARGSLTSLPDLIRRATRLAANLDRGKTASRLGFDFWESGDPEKRDIRQSGLSDMLAAFPPPGQDTPVRSGTPNVGNRSISAWPSAGSRTGGANANENNGGSKKRRRCCGMPFWTFVTILIVLIVVIAAAAVIPVVLVVIPNQKNNSNNNNGPAQDGQGNTGGGNNNNNNNNPPNNPGGTSTMESMVLPAPTSSPNSNQCDGVITCQNEGIAILNSDLSCNCICINGFTGRTCTNNDATGCTATSIADTANNATVGTGIPRLVETANKDFNIPLDATRILSLFSSLSLSCAAENALITFNGLASRSADHQLHSLNSKIILHPTRSLPVLNHPHPPQALAQPAKRQTVGQAGEGQSSSGQKNTPGNGIQTQPVSSNVTALDFARIGVLLALQESGDLDVAASAQEAIQNFLTENRSGNAVGTSVEVGPFEMDLVDFTIQFQNGTTIRAPPQATSVRNS
ncbi:hypothetical protein IAQ61_009821 [Plenodomus lingam]|uniref:uncharacterized protein n=1 Tax=Leptosphaeria maculans TaxID=5022 RepID=UPI003332D494|nr:hypothetical protein IAQ61_009821 [Plenodomus lingam]